MGKNLSGNVEVGVRGDAVCPVVRNAFAAIEFPSTVGLLLSTEEGRDGFKVGSVVVVPVRHESVEEGRGSVEQEGQGTEEEVWVLGTRLLVALQAVLGEVLAVEVALASVLHHAEEGAVERVVVSIGKEVVVSGERRVGFELVVAVETRFRSGKERTERGSGSGVTSNGELLGDKITIGKGETKCSEKCGQIVADVVKVLLSIDKLVECGDTVVRQELTRSDKVKKEVEWQELTWWLAAAFKPGQGPRMSLAPGATYW